MAEVKSFEVTKGKKSGDLLSSGKEEKKLKVGFLACGYFEYWRMYPKTLRKNVKRDMEIIANRLKERYDVVYPGVVDTLDKADAAGRIFEKERIDLLVLAEGTYLPDFISTQAIDYVSKVPVVFFSCQVHEDLDPKSDYEDTLRNSGLIGIAQLGGALTKMGRDFRVVVGSINDDEPYKKIDYYAKALSVVKKLKNTDIGILGHVFRGMYDLEQDKTKIKGYLGPNVIYMQSSHLLDIWKKVSNSDTAKLFRVISKRFKSKGITDDDITRACKLAIAMKRLVERYRLDAFCFLGQHYLQMHTRASERLGCSLLLEEGKHMVACEGDLAGLVMMIIMKSFTNLSPFFGEWGEFDIKNNAILIMGHGFGDPAWAKSDSEVTLTPAPENWGFKGKGVSYQLTAKPGEVTLGHFINDVEGWRMLMTKGEIIDYPTIPCDELTAMVRVDKPVKSFLEELLKSGVAHHVMMVYGDIREELRCLADIMKIRKTEV